MKAYLAILLVLANLTVAEGQQENNHVNPLIASLLDYIGGTECEFQCPNGGQPQPVPEAYFAPSGCGSYHMSFNAANNIDGVKKCCNFHDLCYATCLTKKVVCDHRFQDCLISFCNSKELIKYPYITHSMCIGLANFGFSTVRRFGCEAYRNDQKMSCACREPDNFESSHGLLNKLIKTMKMKPADDQDPDLM